MTRYALTFIVAVCVSFILHAQVTSAHSVYPNGPILEFDTTVYCFDTIVRGTRIRHEFRFTNTGKEPLLFTSATTGCGCYFASFPKGPIAPCKSGVITVYFDSSGRSGPHHRTITVESNNMNGVVVLHLKGVVVGPETGRK